MGAMRHLVYACQGHHLSYVNVDVSPESELTKRTNESLVHVESSMPLPLLLTFCQFCLFDCLIVSHWTCRGQAEQVERNHTTVCVCVCVCACECLYLTRCSLDTKQLTEILPQATPVARHDTTASLCLERYTVVDQGCSELTRSILSQYTLYLHIAPPHPGHPSCNIQHTHTTPLVPQFTGSQYEVRITTQPSGMQNERKNETCRRLKMTSADYDSK